LKTEPEARVGLLSLTALVVGHTIGVGIFLTPAEVVGGLGSPVLTLGLWAVCALLVLGGALAFGELASRFPRAGGLYVYLQEAWGDRVAFLYGWHCLLVMDPGITAAMALGIGQYAVVLWPGAAGREVWIALAAIWTLAAIGLTGLALSARVAILLTAGKVAALGAIAIGALSSGEGRWTNFSSSASSESTTPLLAALAPALVSVFFSFGGFWEASRIAGDVRTPRRVVPLGLALGVAGVTMLYLAITIAFIYLAPAESGASAVEMAERMGAAIAGGAGSRLIAATVVLSAFVSALGLVIMAPRLYAEMRRDGVFPSALTGVSASSGHPVRATILLAALASLFAFVGTLQQVVAFFMGTALVFLMLAAGGLAIVRSRQPQGAAFELPGYPITLAAFVLLIGTIVVLVALNMPWQTAAALLLTTAGLPAYRLCGRDKLRRDPPTTVVLEGP